MFQKQTIWLVAAFFPFVGCFAGGTGIVPVSPNEAGEAILQTRDVLTESGMMNVKLNRMEDTSNFASKFPAAVKAITEKQIVIVWGKSVQDGVTPDRAEIIAYEASAPESGGWVVKNNGEVYKLNAKEFTAIAPKVSSKK